MLLSLNKNMVKILNELNKKRKEKDEYATGHPIYIVQTRKERKTDDINIKNNIEKIFIPISSEEEGVTVTLLEIKNGELRRTSLPCELVMELEEKEDIKEILTEIKDYFIEEDISYNSKIVNIEYHWENIAYFLLEEEAEKYKESQKHNLGVSRIFATHVGYSNESSLFKILEMLDDKNIFKEEKEKVDIIEEMFSQDKNECKTKRVQLLIKQSLHDKLKAVSIKTDISVNELTNRAIEILVNDYELNHKENDY